MRDSLRQWQNMSHASKGELMNRIMTPEEFNFVSAAFKSLKNYGLSDDWVLRRVKGYDWVHGLALIPMSKKDQANEPYFIAISEKEARSYGWTTPAERERRKGRRRLTSPPTTHGCRSCKGALPKIAVEGGVV